MPMEETQPTRVPTIRPVSVEVDFDTFVESDMRACKVLACEPVKKSKRLLRYVLDDGSGTERTIISGIQPYCKPEDLVGKMVLAMVDVPPCSMMGIDSCGMLVSAMYETDGRKRPYLFLLDDDIPAGTRLN